MKFTIHLFALLISIEAVFCSKKLRSTLIRIIRTKHLENLRDESNFKRVETSTEEPVTIDQSTGRDEISVDLTTLKLQANIYSYVEKGVMDKSNFVKSVRALSTQSLATMTSSLQKDLFNYTLQKQQIAIKEVENFLNTLPSDNNEAIKSTYLQVESALEKVLAVRRTLQLVHSLNLYMSQRERHVEKKKRKRGKKVEFLDPPSFMMHLTGPLAYTCQLYICMGSSACGFEAQKLLKKASVTTLTQTRDKLVEFVKEYAFAQERLANREILNFLTKWQISKKSAVKAYNHAKEALSYIQNIRRVIQLTAIISRYITVVKSRSPVDPTTLDQ